MNRFLQSHLTQNGALFASVILMVAGAGVVLLHALGTADVSSAIIAQSLVIA